MHHIRGASVRLAIVGKKSIDNRALRLQIITDRIPYSAALHEPRIILAVTQGDLPGSMELLPTVDMPYRLTLEALRQIIPNCWNKDPTQRPSASRLLERLNCVSPEEEVDPPPTRPPEDDQSSDRSTNHGGNALPTPNNQVLSVRKPRY